MTWRRVLAALLAVVMAAALGACGDDGGADTGPEAQPAEEGAVFVSGDFGAIPVPPLADEVGERSEEDDVIAQSYRLRNTSRDAVFDFYDDRLEGWRLEAAPQPLGEAEDAAWRARWVRDDRRLIVTVSGAPTLESEGASADDPVVQLSLSLEPSDRPLPG